MLLTLIILGVFNFLQFIDVTQAQPRIAVKGYRVNFNPDFKVELVEGTNNQLRINSTLMQKMPSSLTGNMRVFRGTIDQHDAEPLVQNQCNLQNLPAQPNMCTSILEGLVSMLEGSTLKAILGGPVDMSVLIDENDRITINIERETDSSLCYSESISADGMDLATVDIEFMIE